jgi:hypothetical protein
MVTVNGHDVTIETHDPIKVNTYKATLTAYLVSYEAELANKEITRDFDFTLEAYCEYSPILQTTPVEVMSTPINSKLKQTIEPYTHTYATQWAAQLSDPCVIAYRVENDKLSPTATPRLTVFEDVLTLFTDDHLA